jgi:sulfite reductase (NADPH) flavoprotein alpha-component
MSTSTSIYDKNNPFPAKLTENARLSKEGSAKDTRHFVVNIANSGLTYTCGDSLGIYPVNRSEDVEEIITLLGFSGEEQVTLPKSDSAISIRQALSTQLSLAQPTKKMLQLIESKVTSDADKSRIQSLLAADAAEQLTAYLESRELPDLLGDYPSVKLAPQELVDSLRKLNPRLYSIASSPVVHPEEIHLTVAVVRYQTNGRQRHGVCSTFLADRVELNQPKLPVFVTASHFGLPEDPATDVIMVGPGTGVAPFRAFMQERVATNAPGRNWLFFGDQHRKTDYLYEEEWEKLLQEGKLARLDLAFSRDQAEKVYVQDRMLENAAELWKWLSNGACFYVCGDAKRMAKDVDTVLHRIVAQEGNMSEEDAVAWVKQLKKDKRYQRDVY